MARTIYFSDGSREVLLCEDNEKQDLERILRERLGDDTAELFLEIMEDNIGLEIMEDNIGLEDELKSYEASCEDYRNLLQSTQDELYAILGCLQKFNRAQIANSIHQLIQTINNNL